MLPTWKPRLKPDPHGNYRYVTELSSESFQFKSINYFVFVQSLILLSMQKDTSISTFDMLRIMWTRVIFSFRFDNKFQYALLFAPTFTIWF